jgi:uncharacterized protein (TIGR00255 family)
MTGFGHGEACHSGMKFTVELSSVNRKQIDIALSLPPELAELESRIREEIQAAVARGRVNATVLCQRASGDRAVDVALNEPLARAYVHAIRKMQRRLDLPGTLSIDTVLRIPGVFKVTDTAIQADTVWPCIKKALTQALNRLTRMREKEGVHLRADFLKRLQLLERGLAEIEEEAPRMVERYRQQLRERIEKAGIKLPAQDDQLCREVTFFADRSDITEECTRLRSHLKQFQDSFRSTEAVGRRLDFLAQELGREINTIGNKASGIRITNAVVTMKSELEKIREQIQNVE